jgi:hypothetical protein
VVAISALRCQRVGWKRSWLDGSQGLAGSVWSQYDANVSSINSVIKADTDRQATPEALIREARRRQRRRYLVTGIVALTLLAGAAGAAASLREGSQPRPRSRPGPTTAVRPAARQSLPGPIPASVDTTVLLWPVGPDWGPGPVTPTYVDNLTAGHVSLSQKLDIVSNDYGPPLMTVGRWLVYYAGNGATVGRDDLTGRPRVLGATPFFAPSATPDHVWLVYLSGPASPMRVRSVAVTGGPPGPVIVLPNGSGLVEGTDAGLLLADRSDVLELWSPGAAPRSLPYSPQSADGFDANARLVAYGTSCAGYQTAANARYAPNAGYDACRMLRVFNVVTGTLESFRAPRGTTGWVPSGFGIAHAIAPGGSMIAAEAAVSSARADKGRVYVLRLAGRPGRPIAVPQSAGFVLTYTAWSAEGSWLLYQGPGVHLWAYQVTTGRLRSSRTPCCQQYRVIVTVKSRPG